MAKVSPGLSDTITSNSAQKETYKFDENYSNSWRMVRNDPYLCKDVTKEVLPRGYYRKNYIKSTVKVLPIGNQKSEGNKPTNYSNLLSELVVQL